MSSPHPSSKPAPRVPPPLPIPTFATQTGPEQSFASFANAHMRSMRSTRSSSSAVGGPSTSRASASASSTGPYVGLGQDAPPVASGSRKRKAPAAPASATADRKGKGKAKAEDEDDKATVDVSSTTAMAKGKVKGKGKEKAHPDEPQAAAAAAVEAASSRRRVIPPPQPGEESDEETNEAGMERLSDYRTSELTTTFLLLRHFSSSLADHITISALCSVSSHQNAPSVSVHPPKQPSPRAVISVRPPLSVAPFPRPPSSLAFPAFTYTSPAIQLFLLTLIEPHLYLL